MTDFQSMDEVELGAYMKDNNFTHADYTELGQGSVMACGIMPKSGDKAKKDEWIACARIYYKDELEERERLIEEEKKFIASGGVMPQIGDVELQQLAKENESLKDSSGVKAEAEIKTEIEKNIKPLIGIGFILLIVLLYLIFRKKQNQ